MSRRSQGSSFYAFAAAFVTFVVFSPTCFFDFVYWDDEINILDNSHVQSLSGENIRWMFTDFSRALRYSPLSWLGWSLNWILGEGRPFGFHFVNVLFHSANAAWVCIILHELLSWFAFRSDQKNKSPESFVATAALFGTLFWSLHPLRAEPVAWVTGRRYDQALFFALAAFYGFLKAIPAKHSAARTQWLVVSRIAYLASLLTYPVTVELPVVMLIIALAHSKLGHSSPTDRPDRAWQMTLPFFAASALIALATVGARYVFPGDWGDPPTLVQFPLTARVAQAMYVIWFGILKTLAPFGLLPYYTELASKGSIPLRCVRASVYVFSITLAAILLRRRFPSFASCWFSYVALMATKTGFTEQPHFPNDRYSYIAALPFSYLFALGLLKAIARTANTRRWKRTITLASWVGLIALSLLSIRQSLIWRDSHTLLTAMLSRLSGDPFANELYWRLGVIHRDHHRPEKALECFDRSLAVSPNDRRARIHRGQMYLELGRTELGIQELEASLGSKSDSAVRMMLFEAYEKIGEIEKALATLKAESADHPTDPKRRYNVGAFLEKCGRRNEAIQAYRETLDLEPDFPQALQALERLN